MLKTAFVLGKLDRLLLATYLIALMGLLMFPISGPDFRLFGIESDKWMHVALFGGLAMLWRWNISATPNATFVTVGAAFLVVIATEIAQGLVAYRSADLGDLLAGFLGASLGAIIMHRIVSSPVLTKSVGLLVAVLGLMVGVFFGLADVIGVGTSNQFGTLQMAGMGLGAVVAGGGVWVYLEDLRDGV